MTSKELDSDNPVTNRRMTQRRHTTPTQLEKDDEKEQLGNLLNQDDSAYQRSSIRVEVRMNAKVRFLFTFVAVCLVVGFVFEYVLKWFKAENLTQHPLADMREAFGAGYRYLADAIKRINGTLAERGVLLSGREASGGSLSLLADERYKNISKYATQLAQTQLFPVTPEVGVAFDQYSNLVKLREPTPERILVYLREENIALDILGRETTDEGKLNLLRTVDQFQKRLASGPLFNAGILESPRRFRIEELSEGDHDIVNYLIGQNERAFYTAFEAFKSEIVSKGIVTPGRPSAAEMQAVQKLLAVMGGLKAEQCSIDLKQHFRGSDEAVIAQLQARSELYKKYHEIISILLYDTFANLGQEGLARELWALFPRPNPSAAVIDSAQFVPTESIY